MLVTGGLASLRLGSGGKGKGSVDRPSIVQVRSNFAFRSTPLRPPADPIVGPYGARHREFRVQFTVKARVAPREPNPRMGCSR